MSTDASRHQRRRGTACDELAGVTYDAKLAWAHFIECSDGLRQQRPYVFEAVGRRCKDDNPYVRSSEVLLKLEALIGSQKGFEASILGYAEQGAVARFRPASLLNCEGLEARQFPAKAFRKRFVNEDQQE